MLSRPERKLRKDTVQYDLAVVIPSRNEMFLIETVKSILENKRGKTEIIIGLDGLWSNPPIPDHEDITIFYSPISLGQREMTNQCVRLSKAKWIMKSDAHCAFDESFDTKILEGIDENMTVLPALYNLHAFNWRCKKCGNEWYQGPTPKYCYLPGEKKIKNDKCDSQEFERKMIWKPRLHRRSEFYRFDTEPHFQYHNARKKVVDSSLDIVDTMSAQGSCFMLTRKKYWELGICDEAFGSWGSQGIEIACKTWLSGGRLVTNRKTWYSHMFRTQGLDFGFPYSLSGSQVSHAKKLAKSLFFENTWPQQKYSLAWLIKRFAPLNNGEKDGVPDWHDGTPQANKMLDYVNKKGKEFVAKRKSDIDNLTYEDLDKAVIDECTQYIPDNLPEGTTIFGTTITKE
jgi:hypothetical protein